MRICSLLPSATEIVFALGLGDQLVAVTHECAVPAGAPRLPVITRSAMGEARRRSREIHEHVSRAMHDGSSLYHLDQELLDRLDPDLILTQELCEVCAISYDEVRKAVHRLDAARLGTRRTILSLEPTTLAAILETIEQVGVVAGVPERAAELVQALRARIDRIAAATRSAADHPRVFAMEWLDPPYTAGHWVPEMVRLAGGHDDLAREGAPSVEVTWADIATYDPEVLVLMPCSFDLRRALEEFASATLPGDGRRLRAVRSGRVYAVDSATYFSRSGPRIVDGLEILAEILHPELFPRTAPPEAWARVERA